MTYEKPEVEVVKFEEAGFMTASNSYANAGDYLSSIFGDQWEGNAHKTYECSSVTACSPVQSGNGWSVSIVQQNKNKWKVEIN